MDKKEILFFAVGVVLVERNCLGALLSNKKKLKKSRQRRSFSERNCLGALLSNKEKLNRRYDGNSSKINKNGKKEKTFL